MQPFAAPREYGQRTRTGLPKGLMQGMLGAVTPTMPSAPKSARAHAFRVAGADAAVARVGASGGTVARGPDTIPGGDFSPRGAAPAGAAFGLVGSRTGDDR